MSIKCRICIAACLTLFALAPPRARSSGAAGWTVTDLTGAIALEAVKTADYLSTVSLKNKSTEIITAVALSSKTDVQHYEDWMNAEGPGLAPGDEFEIVIGGEGAEQKLIILAVIFEDGSAKGDPAQIEVMNCHRFGQILEASRVERILRNVKDKLDDERVKDLSRQIGRLPMSVDDAFDSLETVSVPGLSVGEIKRHGPKSREALLWGVSTAREAALREVEMLNELPLSSADENHPTRTSFLKFVQERYEQHNKKGIEFVKRMKGGR